MIRLRSLEVYNSIFNITDKINNFEFHKFRDQKIGGVSYTKVRDEIERDLDIPDITATDLQDDLISPNFIDEYREQVARRIEDGAYMNILSLYQRTVFQVSESFLRTEIDLVEDDIRLVFDKDNSSFITYELQTGIYTCKDISEALFNILQLEYPEVNSEIVIEFDDFTRRTKLVLKSGIIAIKFDEKSFFSTIHGFTPGWDFKHYNEYTSQKSANLSSTKKIHLRCDVIDGSVVNGLRQPFLYSFVLDKATGYKIFSEHTTIHFKKINESVLNTISFYLEIDNHEDVNFNGETLTFTLQMIRK